MTTQFAAELHLARHQRREVETITVRHPGFEIDQAYLVQAAGIELRLGEGERVIGGKLGFTSRAMQQAMGVNHPNYGWLTDAMIIDDGVVPLDRLIHPKVEPEIAFLLDGVLQPPVTTTDVLSATTAVMACLEIVDSRYVDFRFQAADNIADNSSAGMLILGDPHPPQHLDLIGVVVSENGGLRFTAAGAAALDHPAAAVAWMVNNCERLLGAGDIVISGGLTAPIDLYPGILVTAEFDRIGTVHLVAD
jgi:2-keto-4-pentenoate hydratase